VVRALGATLRGRPDAAARKLLRQLALDGSVKVSLAAIAGLAAARDPGDAAFLRGLVDQASADRRRAAAWALGELQDLGAVETLGVALSSKDDRFVGDAAWALGEIVVANPKDKAAAASAQRFLYLAKHGGWAAAIDGAGALARVMWATPRESRVDVIGVNGKQALLALAFHKSRLVRINVAHALGSLAGDDDATKALAQLLRDDASQHTRIAAARALAQVGGPKAAAALKLAAADPDPEVRAAATAPAPAILLRSEWRLFYVVDRSADDAPVRQEPYFLHTADGLVWASYTDARGDLTSEHVPAGDEKPLSANRETEY
jgi:HEAT repeat protein